MGKGDDVAEEESVDLAWRVELLRALITGDLPNVERVILSHIETMSAPFTAAMPSWTLQWEGMHWWMLQNATPLFVASAYSRPDIVHWLLLNGADRSTPCYLKQTPVQICKMHKTPGGPPALPSPPTNEVAFSSSYSAEVVITPTGSSQTNSIQQTAYKCLLRVSWQTSLSNGAMIGKYELRYRRLVTEDGSEASSDQEDDKKRPAVDSTTVTWHSERVAHNRKSRQQSALIEGLQFNTVYEFMLRSWNAAGKGEWSPSFQTKTPAVPTRSAGAR
ncbi:Ankyrin repeat-containing domain [Phytophthora cactorum]|nr:Ankyrin repeat-containing domain [Phytophthora cactorum]